MSKKKKIIISVIAAVLIIAVIVSAVVIAMTKGKNAAKASGVYANKGADVLYQAGSTDKYSGVVEAADTMDIKADSEKTVKDILVSEGDEVQVGTPLFTYDTKDLAAKKESATLELERLLLVEEAPSRGRRRSAVGQEEAVATFLKSQRRPAAISRKRSFGYAGDFLRLTGRYAVLSSRWAQNSVGRQPATTCRSRWSSNLNSQGVP